MSNKAASNGEQSIEELQQRYSKLNTKKIQAETNLENARRQLADLQRQAREKYGTDDLAELKQKLADMQAENEAKRAAYQQDLQRIENELADVEQKFAASKTHEKPAS